MSAPVGASPPRSSRPNPAAQRLVWSLFGIVLAGVVAAGVVSWWRQHSRVPDLPRLSEAPDFTLTERSGRTVSRADLAGSVWIADFIFTNCSGVCPLLSTRMASLQQKLEVGEKPGLKLVSFSVDPENDTPEVLRGYADRYRASADGWMFLTGPWEPMRRLVHDGFLLSMAKAGEEERPAPGELITHSDRFVLVDRDGWIRGYYRGSEPESIARLAADAERLRGEGAP